MLLRMFALALILTGLACSSASASFGRWGGGGGAGKVSHFQALPKEVRTPHSRQGQ